MPWVQFTFLPESSWDALLILSVGVIRLQTHLCDHTAGAALVRIRLQKVTPTLILSDLRESKQADTLCFLTTWCRQALIFSLSYNQERKVQYAAKSTY